MTGPVKSSISPFATLTGRPGQSTIPVQRNVAQIVISGTKRHTPKDAILDGLRSATPTSDAEIAAVANYVTLTPSEAKDRSLPPRDVAELRKQTSE